MSLQTSHPLLTEAVEMSEQRKVNELEPGSIASPHGCEAKISTVTTSFICKEMNSANTMKAQNMLMSLFLVSDGTLSKQR